MLKALASPKQLVGQLAERALLWAIERLQRKCAEIEERLQRRCAEIAEIAEIGALPTVKTVVEKLLHYAKALSSLDALRKGFEMAIFGCMAGGDTGLQSEMGEKLRAAGGKLRGALQQIVKIVSFDGDSTEGAESRSVNDAVRLLNNVANLMTQDVDKSKASIAEANKLVQMLDAEVETLVQILRSEKVGGAMKAMREAIEEAMRDALEKAMREAMESTVLSGAGQTARTPQEGGVAAVDEALQLLTMLAHRTGSACAALKKAVRLTKHVSEAIVSAQLPDLQVAGNAAITSALLAYKKDAMEEQREELRESVRAKIKAQRESVRAKIKAYARSLDTLLEDLNKQQEASCQAAPRLTQRESPASPSLTIPSPLFSFNPSSPLSPQLVETIRSVREAMLPEPKELSELSAMLHHPSFVLSSWTCSARSRRRLENRWRASSCRSWASLLRRRRRLLRTWWTRRVMRSMSSSSEVMVMLWAARF
jgi:hypothetical protein